MKFLYILLIFSTLQMTYSQQSSDIINIYDMLENHSNVYGIQYETGINVENCSDKIIFYKDILYPKDANYTIFDINDLAFNQVLKNLSLNEIDTLSENIEDTVHQIELGTIWRDLATTPMGCDNYSKALENTFKHLLLRTFFYMEHIQNNKKLYK